MDSRGRRSSRLDGRETEMQRSREDGKMEDSGRLLTRKEEKRPKCDTHESQLQERTVKASLGVAGPSSWLGSRFCGGGFQDVWPSYHSARERLSWRVLGA